MIEIVKLGNLSLGNKNALKLKLGGSKMDKKDIYSNAIIIYGIYWQMVKAVEEMAELQKELCKKIIGVSIDSRGSTNNLSKIAEEIAGVRIMLEQVEKYYKLEKEIETIQEKKLKRLAIKLEAWKVI